MKTLLITLLLSLSTLLTACSSEPMPDTSMAQTYTVIKESDYPTPSDKVGMEVVIVSEQATTYEQKAHTVIRAAQTILKEHDLYEITVRMSSSKKKFNLIAMVQYNPSQKNTWGDAVPHIWEVYSSQDDHGVAPLKPYLKQ